MYEYEVKHREYGLGFQIKYPDDPVAREKAIANTEKMRIAIMDAQNAMLYEQFQPVKPLSKWRRFAMRISNAWAALNGAELE